MPKQSHRAFDRSAYIGTRLPQNDKRKVEVIAAKRRRDVSSLVIEWIHLGIEQDEREQQRIIREDYEHRQNQTRTGDSGHLHG